MDISTIFGSSSDVAAWVQAVGSIGAIAAGFIYVKIQNDRAKDDRRTSQKIMRDHLGSIGVSIEKSMRERIGEFEKAIAAGQGISFDIGRDSLDVLADDLLSASPIDCGNPQFSIRAREAGLIAKAFVHASSGAIMNGAVVSATAVLRMKTFQSEFGDSIKGMATAHAMEKMGNGKH